MEEISQLHECHESELSRLGQELRSQKRRALYIQRLPGGFVRVFVSAAGANVPRRRHKR